MRLVGSNIGLGAMVAEAEEDRKQLIKRVKEKELVKNFLSRKVIIRTRLTFEFNDRETHFHEQKLTLVLNPLQIDQSFMYTDTSEIDIRKSNEIDCYIIIISIFIVVYDIFTACMFCNCFYYL